MSTKQKGFGAVELILVFVAIGIVGFAGWFVWNSQKQMTKTLDDASKGSNSVVATKKTTATTTTPTASTDVTTKMASSTVQVTHPKDWTILTNNSAGVLTLTKTEGDRAYELRFQFNPTDYLAREAKGVYAANLVTNRLVTVDGKQMYIVISNHDGDETNPSEAMLSTCKPTSDAACSIATNGKYLLVMLHQNVPGTQSVVGLNFNRSDDKAVLDEAVAIIKTLRY